MRYDGDITVNVVYGDVSGDGKVTAHDADLILRYLVGLEALSDGQIIAGDVSQNRRLTTLDATLILQYVSGLITF